MDLPGMRIDRAREHTSLGRNFLDLDSFGEAYGGQEDSAYERPG